MDEDTGALITEPTDRNIPQSPMEALRARRDEVASRHNVLIQIPTYEEMGLKAKYRLLDRGEAEDIGKNIRGQTKDRDEAVFRVMVDTIIASCEGFFLAPDGVKDEDAEPLLEEQSGKPVLHYKQLAVNLGADPQDLSNRSAVAYVFGDNEFAVGSHGMLLQRWQNNTMAKVDEDLLG